MGRSTGFHRLSAKGRAAHRTLTIDGKAMPVILATEDDCETWLTAPAEEALALQRRAPDELLQIVATGAKSDGMAA